MLNVARSNPHVPDPDWNRLKDLIREFSFRNDRTFMLASGRESRYYFNLKPTMLCPEGAKLIAKLTLTYVESEGIKYVGGLAVGAVPIVSQVVMLSHGRSEILGFYVRDEKKAHGTKDQIYGHLPKNNEINDVILCDDVTTTGGSVLKAVYALRDAGCRVHSVITIVDRLEGAKKNLAEHGIRLEAIFDMNDFIG